MTAALSDDELTAAIDDAVADYQRLFRPPFALAPNLGLAVQALARAERAEAERDQAVAETERLHSWRGVMGLLDEHWPEWLFPTMSDDDQRDPGPRIVSLVRRADRAEAAIQRVRDVHRHTDIDPRDTTDPYGLCLVCFLPWPCPTLDALDPKETT